MPGRRADSVRERPLSLDELAVLDDVVAAEPVPRKWRPRSRSDECLWLAQGSGRSRLVWMTPTTCGNFSCRPVPSSVGQG